jgi:crossover junction endodeoxyribonuclease RusA
MRIELPFPPSLNTYYRHCVLPLKSGRGRSVTLISKQGREYRAAVVRIAAGTCAKLAGRLSVALELYPPDRRARDLDNHFKAALDALTHAGVWGDDSQIDRLAIVRRDIVRGGKLIVEVEVIQ